MNICGSEMIDKIYHYCSLRMTQQKWICFWLSRVLKVCWNTLTIIIILNNEVDKDILLIITEQILSIINGYIQFLFIIRVTKLIRNTIVSKEHNNDVHVNLYNVNRQCFNCKIKNDCTIYMNIVILIPLGKHSVI